MSGVRHRMRRLGGRIGVWLYRTFDGRYSSPKGVDVLMITSPGRRTGLPRSTCVRYLDTGDGLLVWGTGSGSPRDPDWVENLRRTPVATVQRGPDATRMRAEELRDGEREDRWQNVVLARAPEVDRYARKAGRTIPVLRLTPADAGDPPVRP